MLLFLKRVRSEQDSNRRTPNSRYPVSKQHGERDRSVSEQKRGTHLLTSAIWFAIVANLKAPHPEDEYMKFKRLVLLLTLVAVLPILFTACATPAPEQVVMTVEVQGPAGETMIITATPAPEAATPEPWAPLKESDFTSANIDWTGPAQAGPAEGITLHVAALSHPYINALRPYVPLFEQLTGIKVAYDVLPVEEYWTKTAADLSGGTGFYDLVMTGTEFEWGYQEANWIMDLNTFLDDPTLTDKAWYNVEDFYPYDWNAHAWNGEYGVGTYGQGRQNAVPVNSEPLMLICNQKILDEAGLPGPPTTWQEWADYAAAMTANGHYGVVQRGARDYSLMYGYAPGFFAYGGTDLDPVTLKPNYNCPNCVEYTQLYGDTLRQYGPPGQTNIGWDGVIAHMASGDTGCTVDDMAFAESYENPDQSQIPELGCIRQSARRAKRLRPHPGVVLGMVDQQCDQPS